MSALPGGSHGRGGAGGAGPDEAAALVVGPHACVAHTVITEAVTDATLDGTHADTLATGHRTLVEGGVNKFDVTIIKEYFKVSYNFHQLAEENL